MGKKKDIHKTATELAMEQLAEDAKTPEKKPGSSEPDKD